MFAWDRQGISHVPHTLPIFSSNRTTHTLLSYSSLSTFLGLLSPDPDPSLHGFPPIIPIFPIHFLHSPVRGLCLCLCSLGAILAAWSARWLSSIWAQITPHGSAYARPAMLCSLPMHGRVDMYIQQHRLGLEKWGPPAADPLPKSGVQQIQ